jgi:type I restriction enzyme M protein
MRANAPAFGKRTPLTEGHFADFEKAFGADPFGKIKRKDGRMRGRRGGFGGLRERKSRSGGII